MPRLKMVWLPLRKWISFLPVAFIIYILLQYLVYHPELRVSSAERSTFIGEAKLLNLTSSLQNVEDPPVISTTATNGTGTKDVHSDPSNGVKENSVSSSSFTVERSVRASVSSSKDDPSAPEIEVASSHSQTNGRDLPQESSDKKDPSSKHLLESSDNQSAPEPKQPDNDVHKTAPQKPSEKSPKKAATRKDILKQAIAKNRNKPKPKFSISYLHGNTKVSDVYDNGFMVPQEELCPNNGRDLRVIIFVTTAPDHEHHRNAIRQTWGHFGMRKDVSIGFLVGRPDKQEVQTLIDRENDRYGDIIQANVIDVYANLTLKTVSMFEWLSTYCSEVRFVLKTDDDMYINVPLLLAFIYTKRNDKRAIYGRLARNWKPVRNKKSKYYISKEIYRTLKYPEFLTGPAYLFTNDIVDDIYAKALESIFFKLEDVFTTGLVAESLGIKRVGDSHFRNEKISLKDTCKLMQTISIHMVKYEEEFDIYKRTLDGKTKCRIK